MLYREHLVRTKCVRKTRAGPAPRRSEEEQEAAYCIDFHLKDCQNWAVIHDLQEGRGFLSVQHETLRGPRPLPNVPSAFSDWLRGSKESVVVG